MAVTERRVSLSDERLQEGAYLEDGKKLMRVTGIESSLTSGIRIVLENAMGVRIEGGASYLFEKETVSPAEVVETYRLVRTADGRPPMRSVAA